MCIPEIKERLLTLSSELEEYNKTKSDAPLYCKMCSVGIRLKKEGQGKLTEKYKAWRLSHFSKKANIEKAFEEAKTEWQHNYNAWSRCDGQIRKYSAMARWCNETDEGHETCLNKLMTWSCAKHVSNAFAAEL